MDHVPGGGLAMDGDQGNERDSDQGTERFTDEEAAFLRYVRFGALPARVPLSELVGTVETDARRDVPETLGDPVEWRYTATNG